MIETGTEQRSPGWFRARNGHLTGSRAGDIMRPGRRKDEIFSETAKSYLYDLAAERMFNPDFLNDDEVYSDYIEQNSYTTKAMQWGIEQEEAAKRLFMNMNFPDDEIQDVSSCKHDIIPWFAASPDGIIRDMDGGIHVVEVKCPKKGTYMKYRSLIHDAESLKEVEPGYYWQMMAEMSCTGAKDGIFITYCPWLTSPIHWAKIEGNVEDIRLLEERVILANQFIDEIINK